jgi:hypothetical protein
MKSALFGAVALAAVATPALAEDWHVYSRSQSSVYMAEVDSIVAVEMVTRMNTARAPRSGDAGDYTHTTEVYEFQCAGRKWRTAGAVEFGPDGAEAERYPEEGAAWESARTGTVPDQLLDIACDGARASQPTWPTVRAWVDAGRL